MKNYIVIEGMDWVGKTTVAKLVHELFSKERHFMTWILTKEPGSPHIPKCQKIRETIIQLADQLDDWAIAGLFAADARIHLEFVKKCVDSGMGVVSDRCFLSDIAYRPNHGDFREANMYRFGQLDPVVILLTADVSTIEKRRSARNDMNNFERQFVASRIEEISKNYDYFMPSVPHLRIETDHKTPQYIAYEIMKYVEALESNEILRWAAETASKNNWTAKEMSVIDGKNEKC